MSFQRRSFTGGGRGSGAPFKRGQSAVPLPRPAKPFGPVVDSFNAKDLLIENDAPKIKYVRYVASYNWVDGGDPVILVPGSPPAWTPPVNEDAKLNCDKQGVFRDINAAKYVAYPLEPAVRSILALEPKFDLQAVDVVGCGSTIGNLLRYASLPSQAKAFRFDVDCVGDTVFFTRRESSPTETIQDLRGYGHTFPERYTTWDSDVRQSCSHQRIVQYQFGGLQVLLRSETDAYLKAPSVGKTLTSSESHSSILDTLDSISVSQKTSSSDQGLVLKMQGTKVPQSRIFDIKTRSDKVVFDMKDIIPRLWLNQTPNFLIAYHHYGVFNSP